MSDRQHDKGTSQVENGTPSRLDLVKDILDGLVVTEIASIAWVSQTIASFECVAGSCVFIRRAQPDATTLFWSSQFHAIASYVGTDKITRHKYALLYDKYLSVLRANILSEATKRNAGQVAKLKYFFLLLPGEAHA